ncbi:MAG: hypothetical protein SWO11_12720 [Thermodesulfobacteriota bacterium]|nr:hypothetical protein [Thermodesulfobacteriota bacterium]
MEAVSYIPILEITKKVQEVGQSMINENAVSPEFEEDALHIAVASINSMDFLLIWNFSHINNGLKK